MERIKIVTLTLIGFLIGILVSRIIRSLISSLAKPVIKTSKRVNPKKPIQEYEPIISNEIDFIGKVTFLPLHTESEIKGFYINILEEKLKGLENEEKYAECEKVKKQIQNLKNEK